MLSACAVLKLVNSMEEKPGAALKVPVVGCSMQTLLQTSACLAVKDDSAPHQLPQSHAMKRDWETDQYKTSACNDIHGMHATGWASACASARSDYSQHFTSYAHLIASSQRSSCRYMRTASAERSCCTRMPSALLKLPCSCASLTATSTWALPPDASARLAVCACSS